MTVLVAIALATSLALVVHLHNNADHVPALGAAARPLELLAIAACTLMSIALYRRWRDQPTAPRPWRLAFYALVLTWLSSFFHDYEQGGSYYAFILGAGALAAAWSFALRLPRAVDIVLTNVCVLVVGAELSLRVVARFVHSPLFGQESTDARHWLDANKLPPRSFHFGFPVNSHGFADDEPSAKEGCLVAAVGDSFTVGMVAHEYHFATVAERTLGCRIDAIGVAAVGPEEYALLVRDEALALDPDVVVLDLFVGNDLVDNLRGRDRFRNGLRRWLDRDNLLAYSVPRRLYLLFRARRLAHEPLPVQVVPRALTHDETLQRWPWLADPSLEPSTMPHAQYLELESRHAREVCGGGDEVYYARFWEIFDGIRAAVAPRRLLVLVIPDEFQVEDPLWHEITSRLGVPLDRDRPQRLVGAGLTRRGIPYLDLLPAMRGEPVAVDGWRHLYLRDDTHWNARGNAVAGRMLAASLRGLLPSR
jgi:hypothetical protein